MVGVVSFREFFGFDNPFSLTPEEKEKIWADQKELKQEVENIIKLFLMTSPTRLIILYGDWGSGKTHAMRYFTNEENLKSLSEPLHLTTPLAISLICPTNQAFNTLYIKIVEKIYPRLVEVVKVIDDSLGSLRDPRLLQSELSKYIENKNLVKVLSQVTDTRKEMLVEKYLLMTAKPTELDKLGVPRGISTYVDMIETLSNIFTFLMESNKYLKIIIWIDEGEHVFAMTGKDLLEFQTFLRDLIDHVPRNLLILINASLKPGQSVQEFVEYLGEPNRRRINRVISSPEMRPEEAIQYVKDYLQLLERNPFETNTIESTIAIIAEEAKNRGLALTPALVNAAFSVILDTAYFEKKDTITIEFINNIKDKLISATFSQYRYTTESLL